ncbi:MAG: hypothetical protein M3Z01_06170 [Thermoproteota archaeon]|nr:hypothetical protein [Thermoproteota archaeon]
MFFIDNRKRYFDTRDINSKQKIKKDVIKLVTSLGVAEIGYLSIKFFSTYIIFASSNLDGSQVSITSTILAWLAYFIIANIMVKKYHLF